MTVRTAVVAPAEEELRRARRARELMEDETFVAAMQAAETDIIARWRAGKTPTEREDAHAEMRGLELLKKHFRIYISRGEAQQPLASQ